MNIRTILTMNPECVNMKEERIYTIINILIVVVLITLFILGTRPQG